MVSVVGLNLADISEMVIKDVHNGTSGHGDWAYLEEVCNEACKRSEQGSNASHSNM